MNLKSIILSCALMGSIHVVAAQQKVYIHGQLQHPNVGDVLYLNYLNNGESIQDSIVLQANGKFEFRAEIHKETIARLFISHPENPGLKKNSDKAFFYLEKGKVSFQSSDSLRTAVIISGPLNKDYSLLKTNLLPLEQRREVLFSTLTEDNRKSEQFVAQYRKENEEIATQIKQVYSSFIRQHPGSTVSFYALERVGGAFPDYQEMNNLYSSLSSSTKGTEEGLKWRAKLDLLKNTAIGAEAPNFSSQTVSGDEFQLNSLKGKYVLLDFWASWCSPCRQESPYLIQAFDKYADKGFTILNVSLDSKNAKAAWIKAIEEDKIGNWNHVSDLNGFNSEVAKLYGIQAIPQNFLLDKNGKIIAKNLRGEELLRILGEQPSLAK
ncbi:MULTISPECIES: TlpA disulfide reductase family protein [Sphingobacterium]|uniref:TlpA disulfide reductase family protein n=1 Tax=Sphingobacterium TaxID=28453 RepID=UPI001047AB57|nr:MULTISPECIES: TlpA disulfide reductase family protein [Sphingobacterium]MCW2263110.1 thiol-disulfide isomerase/thioredoxin [Sphingobacterium kitahiroshimense]TCR11906.1 thiol-disulfide isomerase/thioredoxin [Sphingobacterium sp. JUb78]